MKLQELLKNIKPTTIDGNTDVEITGVNIDSRKIKDGHLFVAMKGTQVDGHKFIGKAIESGAKAILCEDMPQEKNGRQSGHTLLWRPLETLKTCRRHRHKR